MYLAYVLTPFIKNTWLTTITDISIIGRNESKYCTRWAPNLHYQLPLKVTAFKWVTEVKYVYSPAFLTFLIFLFFPQLYFVPACLEGSLWHWHCEYKTVYQDTLILNKKTFRTHIHSNLQCFISQLSQFYYYFIPRYLIGIAAYCIY